MNFCCDQAGKPFLNLWWMDCIKSWKSELHIILWDVDFIYNFSELFLKLKLFLLVSKGHLNLFIQIGSRAQKSTQNTVRAFLVVTYYTSFPFNVPCQQFSDHVFLKLSKAGVTNYQPAYETVWKLSHMLQIWCASCSLSFSDSFLWGARVPYWNECR